MKTQMLPCRRSFPVRKFPSSALLTLVAAALLPPATHASFAPLPFYEPFPVGYAEGGNLGAGTSLTLWHFGNSATSSSARTATTAALGYPQLTTDTASSKGIASRPAGAGAKDRGVSLSIPPNTTLYASCIFNVQSTNFVTSRFFGLSIS